MQDALGLHPVQIHFAEQLSSTEAVRIAQAADQHAVWAQQIADGGALREEFGVREDLELGTGPAVRLEDRAHRGGRTAGHRGLFHNDLGACRHARDPARRRLHVAA